MAPGAIRRHAVDYYGRRALLLPLMLRCRYADMLYTALSAYASAAARCLMPLRHAAATCCLPAITLIAFTAMLPLLA